MDTRVKIGLYEDNWYSALQRVLSKMIVNENGCWIYLGYMDKISGYGHINIGNVRYKTHRFIAYCFHGLNINDLSLDACHSCDVRNCINPFHIWIGTRSQNLKDSVSKNRWHGGKNTNGNFTNHLKEKDWGIHSKN